MNDQKTSVKAPFDTYIGGKSGDGVYQKIINHIPKHEIRVIPFLGNGGVHRNLKSAFLHFLNDLDHEVYMEWVKLIDHQKDNIANVDAIRHLSNLGETSYDNKNTFIYLDPPYLSEVRNDRDYYAHEFKTREAHGKLLTLIKTLNCRIMISSYPNELYDTMLGGWYTYDFLARTRQGSKTERIYMNYDISEFPLHDTRYVGNNYRERERINKKKKSWTNRFKNLPIHEQQVLLESLQQQFPHH